MPKLIAPKVLSWASILEERAFDQASMAARLPFVPNHVALMPDTHAGYGPPVGAVIPTKGAVIPYAVGVDIGCGMVAAHLAMTAAQLPDSLQPFLDMLPYVVPAGLGKQHDDDRVLAAGDGDLTRLVMMRPEGSKIEKIVAQYGSLGGGNHFVEVCLDQDDTVWLMLHSGSRGTGKDLADRHVGIAKDLMDRFFITLEDPNMAYLPEGAPEFWDYIKAMRWAQDYAMASRNEMMTAALKTFRTFVSHDVPELQRVNCHHNFCQMEHHMGQNVWITRKGAIQADEDRWGIIPGSMGAKSFIVQGLGNPASYESCSHGAGRTMSRAQARREITVEKFTEQMGERAWQSSDATDLLDEAPGAYKAIDVVMADQADLVVPRFTLHQVLSYKGVDANKGRRRGR